MPTYTYQREDGTQFEEIQSIKEDALTVCPTTGQKVFRVIGNPMVKFKGQDWDIHRQHRRYTIKQDGDDRHEQEGIVEQGGRRKYVVTASAVKARLDKQTESEEGGREDK